jgi:CspA family cold shock protein
MSSDRSTGSVKWFNNKAGYGFVTIKGGDNDGKDVFVHYSAIKVVDDQFRYLIQGEYIEFDLTKDESNKHEFVVSNISGIKGGSLMCEVQRNNESNKQREVYKYVKDDGFKPAKNSIRRADLPSSRFVTDKEMNPSTEGADSNLQLFKPVSRPRQRKP